VGSESTWWNQIRGAAAGDASARNGFVRRYEPLVRAYLTTRWGRGPLRGDVDDTVQDVFLECFRERGGLQKADPEKGSFRAFLYGIVRNVARRIESKQAGRREAPPGAACDVEVIPEDDESVSQVFERAWARTVMREAAERQAVLAQESGAPAVRRVELLRLRFEEGLPIREIAARWEVEAAWLHHEYARARREFRDIVLAVVEETEPGCDPEAEAARLLGLLANDTATARRARPART
jgi:RNA polymerase sigma factor (sigma-70 family)